MCARAKHCVLIVEDEPLIADYVQSILEDADARIEVCGIARTSAEAERMLDRNPQITFAFVDYMLGEGNADGIAFILRARGIPFIVCSAWTGRDLDRRPYNDAAATLQKPASDAVIRRVVREVIQGLDEKPAA